MRQLHVYDCALTGVMPMRVVPGDDAGCRRPRGGPGRRRSRHMQNRETCPPVCDQIPDTAWIQQRAVPLNSTYNWPAPAGLAVQVTGTRRRASGSRSCVRAAAVPQDPRDSAVAARVTVVHPDGQWQLQAQILHWRGDTARGGATAASVFSNARRGAARLPAGVAAAVAVDHQRRTEPDGRGHQRTGHHAYLPGRARGEQHDQRADALVVGSAAGALAVDGRRPRCWTRMTAPLCEAYIASCP